MDGLQSDGPVHGVRHDDLDQTLCLEKEKEKNTEKEEKEKKGVKESA